MKTPLLVLAGAAVLVLGACAIWNRGGVNIDDTYVEIRPGTNINGDDQAKLLTILTKYNNKLFWVEKIGSRPEEGKLTCMFVHETLLDEVVKGWEVGTSYSSIQIGIRRTKSNCDQTHHTPVMHFTQNPHQTQWSQHTPFDHHTPNPHLTSQKDYSDSTALVREVTPILEKYTRK